MLPCLVLIPIITSLVLGIVYVFHSDGPRAIKIIGILAFGTAMYLQFFSRHALVGMLLQVALALSLALWRKMDTAA